jgi:hypothetical protein
MLDFENAIRRENSKPLMPLSALARKNGGDGGRCLSLSKAGWKHRFFCPFLGSSFGQAKGEQKK